ncbi:hypothetical protein LC653_44170 [Nostoc sp. CHAB 5784]|uniref:hypothetical protein n=1 Tax=Nostoc mirabile TaxID=2907820 RepID=UPI001E63031B|nr:hypothetical protein [Nostoc mirabile]MCC5670588.1 hypothetical protein [Nostoc mirabile CHAB5784]
MLEGIKFVGLDEVKRLLDGLSQEEKETLLTEQMKKLSAESRARVLGLSESGLTVITGSFVSLNSDVSINIQNASGFDAEAVFKALIDFRRSEKESK